MPSVEPPVEVSVPLPVELLPDVLVPSLEPVEPSPVVWVPLLALPVPLTEEDVADVVALGSLADWSSPQKQSVSIAMFAAAASERVEYGVRFMVKRSRLIVYHVSSTGDRDETRLCGIATALTGAISSAWEASAGQGSTLCNGEMRRSRSGPRDSGLGTEVRKCDARAREDQARSATTPVHLSPTGEPASEAGACTATSPGSLLHKGHPAPTHAHKAGPL